MKTLIMSKIGIAIILLFHTTLLNAQLQANVTPVESAGTCDLLTNCDTNMICIDIILQVDQGGALNSYNIMVEYNGDVLSREAFNSNNNAPIGDNTCVLDNAVMDTDLEGPPFNPDHWRVAAVQGLPGVTMEPNIPVTVHTICFKILQPTQLDGQVICVGGDVGGLVTSVTLDNGMQDGSVPETCMTLDENFTSCSLLPIKLLDFEVTKKDRTAVLEWTTSYESNLNYFEVQKAGEDKHFSAVGKVSGAGNSTSIQSYRFVDSSPFSGTNYYRLRSVDIDGKQDLSVIRSVQFDVRTPQFSIHPNPTSGEISVRSDDQNTGPFEIAIYSLDGRPVYSTRMGKADQQISLQDVEPGIYELVIRGQGYEWHEKLVKVN